MTILLFDKQFMYKNLIILGIATLLISVTGVFLTSWINHDRYNPVRFIEAETQSCKKVSDCTLFFAYCGNNIQLPIKASNKKRYADLLEKHCKETPSKSIVDVAETGKELTCKNQVCNFQ